jgi:uncharacterized protein YjaZ
MATALGPRMREHYRSKDLPRSVPSVQVRVTALVSAPGRRIWDTGPMSAPVELVSGHAARIQRALPSLIVPFQQARDTCSERLGAEGIEIHVLDAPDECIPEWGIGGSTYGPRSIVLAVDPDHRISGSDVYSTLVHEIHHAIRWRGQGCGSTLGERLVFEGLAQVYEHECTGRVPLYAQGDVSTEHRALAVAELDEGPADEGRWFFGASDLPRWFGYRLGYSIVKPWTDAHGRNAAAMVQEPAETFLRGLKP